MNKKTSEEIIEILKEVIPNREPELNFNNSFELVCAVLLSAQTTDKRVNIVTEELFKRYPTPKALSEAAYSDVYNIIVSLGLAKNKANNLINLGKAIYYDFNNEVPNTLEELMKLPGVGRKTALVVLALAFNIPAIPVDTHLHRMAIRLGYINSKETVLDAEKSYMKYIPRDEWIDAHHLFLLFGRYHCKSINPKCDQCKLIAYCKK
ncbi:MAG: endonuclease III [Erysipelotrichaceae bacterium]|nr:endonuclease III [Erysipelotrichaceae bacterium]